MGINKVDTKGKKSQEDISNQTIEWQIITKLRDGDN